MKNNLIRISLIGLILTVFMLHVEAQVQYNGCTVTGTYASAIGKDNTASGNNSFAGGYTSQATGSNSFAFGYNSKATQSTTAAMGNTAIASGVGSVAIGNYVKATAQNAFVLGFGTTASYPLTNSTPYSIAFGVNSNKPTLLITKSLNNNYTGKVAIGQISNPLAKLHIRSDSNEDAGVFIEPSNTNSYKAFVKLFDNSHSITVDKTGTMELNSGEGNLLLSSDGLLMHADKNIDLQSGNIKLTGKVGINTDNTVSDYALAVDGGVITTKVFIKEVKQWPDYVFADHYDLMELSELKNYLSVNHHLPGVPSEAVILNEGYDMNEMQTIMMEKIEEMARYIILLQDQIDELKSKANLMEDSIVFTYDSNGNRISRSLVFKRISPTGQEAQDFQPLSYELFPNPTPGFFTVQCKELEGQQPFHAKLLTATGIILEEKDVENGLSTFDLSGQASGIFLLELDTPEGHQSWKVIKR